MYVSYEYQSQGIKILFKLMSKSIYYISILGTKKKNIRYKKLLNKILSNVIYNDSRYICAKITKQIYILI
jgi:hypothetical protein